MTNKHILKDYKVLFPFLGIISLSFFLFAYSKGEVVLMLNKLHSPYLNFFFKKLSSIGNAVSIFLFLLIVLRFKLKYIYFFVLAFAIGSFVIILCKHVIFDGMHRPFLFFKEQGILNTINFVEGVKIRKYDSFPSGHTAYSFFLATFFSLKYRELKTSTTLFVLALFIGVSRMYLVQHFFMDVFTGAIVGCFRTCIAYRIVFSKSKNWYNHRIKVDFFNRNSPVAIIND